MSQDELRSPVPKVTASAMAKKSWSELFEASQSFLSNSNHSTATQVPTTTTSGNAPLIASKPPSRPTSSFSSRPSSTLTLSSDVCDSSTAAAVAEIPASLDGRFLYQRPLSIRPRPIQNRGNRCFMIAVLQALLNCVPFVNYFTRYLFLLEEIEQHVLDDSQRFPLLAAFNRLLCALSVKQQPMQNVIDCDFVDSLFLALPQSFSGIGLGEQMDAEEFLTVFLDTLAEELMEMRKFGVRFLLPFESSSDHQPHQPPLMTPSAAFDDGGEWLQMGPKQRVHVTRSTPVSQSPIHVLFAGSFRSCFKASGPSRPSITFEPFTVLSLELVDAHQQRPLGSVSEALAQATQLEHLPTGSKQLSFSALPALLVIQLKRFTVNARTGEFTKLTSPVRLQPRLQFGNDEFDLVAVVHHLGSTLHAGHYTATVRRKGREWREFDDEAPERDFLIDSEGASCVNSKSAYLLFYQRINKQE